ncbi:MAG TPA: crotonase/enoyl-CoA hydratase family protein [Candidatus Eisenbacteria bacterium]|nr:crotonase/enoyl-CoA hydratase family protein [Candidatus Eisenbacteria bacterium]
MKVERSSEDGVLTVTIARPEVRNAVDAETAAALADAFRQFEEDSGLAVAVLTGAGGNFCAGFDLKALAAGAPNRLPEAGEGPMGPTRMALSKPVIAAIEGYAVAGGLELALWCDLRVAARDATLGVFNRRFGVPLIDLGTVRLPRLIGQGRALDMILTGRPVAAEEALRIGLVTRLVEPGRAVDEAQKLAHEIAAFPSGALRADRRSVLNQWSLSLEDAAEAEHRGGLEVLESGDAQQGARRFSEGAGRHGS